MVTAEELARANFPTDVPPPFESPVFPIPEYMRKPQVFEIFGHRIRIWRTEIVRLTRDHASRVSGLLEFTPLNGEQKEPLGLRWMYSAHVPKHWASYFRYVLHGHWPGDQPAADEAEVYRLTSLEIHWMIRKLNEQQNRRNTFSLRELEREGP